MTCRSDAQVVAVAAVIVVGGGVDAHLVTDDPAAASTDATVAESAAALTAEAASAPDIDTTAAIFTATTAVVAAGADTVDARLRVGIAGIEACAAMREVVREDDAVVAADRVTAGAAFVIGAPAGTALAA